MDLDFVNYKFENGFVGVVTRTKFRLGIRHVQLAYMCLCAVVFGVLRGAAPVAVLALADRSRLNDTYIQVYNYNKSVQGTVLSSFLWGHALLLLPAEAARGALGGKLMISAALLVNGAIYVALPTIVNQGGWIALCNAQFVLGMTHAAAAPALRALLLAWLPPHERETFSPIVYGGIQLGTIVAFPVAGAISASALGWELVFYSLAMMTLSAAAVWALLTAGRPADHPAVGDKEKEFIDEALKCYKQKQLKTPWGQMLRSGATWGLAAAHVGCSVVVTFFLTEVPAYLVLARGFTVKQVWCEILL
ncbi:hypothetical protein JYU34_006233 [Plutella xylostella]|uniref:Major facilitator superfamily (MFS) profile domain-containing protein n=1 Tax=Plutella xylostella TaxID=51655 RepID=A0ABQ7QV74_PLUXY|nr:hypothetical protein JYU34_006233 [Plutella xylostella]